MLSIALVIMFISSIIELYFFTVALVSGESLFLYSTIHIVLIINYYLMNLYFIKSKKEEKPIFITFFLPGLGFLIVFTIEFFTAITKRKTEEINMVTIFEILEDTNEYNFLSEDKVLSYSDNMKYLDNDDQLSLLFDVLEDGTYDKLKILKQGAENENQVIKYYSSVYLSSLANQFENELFRLSDKFTKTDNLIDLKNLITTYDSYLISGLLKDDMYDFFNKKNIHFLEMAIEAEIQVIKNSVRLVNAYLNDEQYDKAIKMIEKNKITHPADLEMRILEINYYAKYNNNDKITKCVKDIYDKFSYIPPKELSILKFWSKEVA
ncbi:hypothetical protein RJG79_05155 [Mycoplasmatota bacterium WC44]